MSKLLSIPFGIIIVFPFLVTFLVLLFFRKKGIAPAKVIGIAADWTTPFLFLAVFIVSRTIVGFGAGFYLAAFAILITIAYTVKERLQVKEFRIVHLLRKIWRLFFLILSLAYAILLIVGIVLKIIEYAS
jgi:hypothetical protein